MYKTMVMKKMERFKRLANNLHPIGLINNKTDHRHALTIIII